MSFEHPRHNAVHYPQDRRFFLRVNRPMLVVVATLLLVPVAAAWCQYLLSGLPALPPPPAGAAADALAFPAWLRLAHFANFLLLVLMARSGLSILMDHPRLYWTTHCTPGREWARFTPIEVPEEGLWTAKEDARYISPFLGLPGYRHTIGMARHWHFLPALFWFANGAIYLALLFGTGEWLRLVPDSWRLIPEAWATFVHYVTLHLPPEPHILVRYNALQQLAYFGVVFVMAPLSFLTGMAMSPSLVSRFPWYARLFGGRQAARSIHFLLLLSYLGFLVVHVTLVATTGFSWNMNRIVRGVQDGGPTGAILGMLGIVAVVAACALAHWMAWHHPRVPQYLTRRIHLDLMKRLVFGHLTPKARYTRADISPYFWPNGKLPDSAEWRRLADGEFREFRLRVSGLVEHPVELSLEELRALGRNDQITMHHCIQGWTGIAEWGGLPMARLVELVRPHPEVRTVVFRSFGDGLYGGEYYDTQRLANVLLPQCILAYEMNGAPLGRVYGAPLRLRVENQLGYKMVKWIRSIEFVVSELDVGLGHGGKNEDDEYFDLVPDI